MKYTYQIEILSAEQWVTILRDRSLHWCHGYLEAKSEFSPRLGHRIVRSDNKVIDEFPPGEDVNIGMIAGWPTAEQYERAANKALAQATFIRERDRRRNHQ